MPAFFIGDSGRLAVGIFIAEFYDQNWFTVVRFGDEHRVLPSTSVETDAHRAEARWPEYFEA